MGHLATSVDISAHHKWEAGLLTFSGWEPEIHRTASQQRHGWYQMSLTPRRRNPKINSGRKDLEAGDSLKGELRGPSRGRNTCEEGVLE